MSSNWTKNSTVLPATRHRRRAIFVRSLFCTLLTAVAPLFGGCKPNKRFDLIEAELRTRERELEATRVQLEQARNLNRAHLQQSAHAAQPPPPHTPTYIPVKEIVLARGTGGVDDDGAPGDDGLMVVIVPRDEDGAGVKVPGRIDIAAWEITPAGIKNPIGSWCLPVEKVRPTWRSGFISTGYFIAVPWQTIPSQERIRVAVRFTTFDGRAFETDKDFTVRLRESPRIDNPASFPNTPVQPGSGPQGPRVPLFPDPLPTGVEELPPPSPDRGAKLLPPEKE